MEKYSFSMTKKEIMEFGIREQLFFRFGLWFSMAAICYLEIFKMHWLAVFFVVFIIVLITVMICRGYSLNKKNLYSKTRTMWVEDGLLKVDGEVYSEIECSNVRVIKETRNLLMLGVCQAKKHLVWYPVPRRVFSDSYEFEDFLYVMHHTKQSPYMHNADIISDEDNESELFRFSFWIGKGKWKKILMDVAEIDHSGVLGYTKKRKVIWAILGINLAVFVYGYFFYYNIVLLSINYLTLFLLIMALKSAKGNPEKRIKWALKYKHRPDDVYGIEDLFIAKILKKDIFPNDVYGAWEISITETGVMWYGPQSGLSYGAWDKFSCMVETDAAFYLFFMDKKHFIMILKECFGSYEQEEALKQICMEKKVAVIMGKKVKYVPNCVFTLLLAMLVLIFLLSAAWLGLH